MTTPDGTVRSDDRSNDATTTPRLGSDPRGRGARDASGRALSAADTDAPDTPVTVRKNMSGEPAEGARFRGIW